MARNRCKDCCCSSPIGILVVLTVALIVIIGMGGFIIANKFTINPTKEELFVGSIVGGIVAVAVIGMLCGLLFLIIYGYRERRKIRDAKLLKENGVVLDIVDIEGGNDFDDVLNNNDDVFE